METCQQVRLSELIHQNALPEKIVDTRNERYVTVSLYGKGVRERVIKDDKYPVPFVGYRVSEGQFIYSRIDARNGAYGIIGPELDGFVVSKDFPVYDIDTSRVLPQFLLISVLGDSFLRQVKNSSFGATNRMRIKEEVLENYAIFLPSIEEQAKIAKIIGVAQSILELRRRQLCTLDTLIKARFVEMFEQGAYDEIEFGDVCEFLRNGANIKQTKGALGIPITRIETLANDIFNTDRLGYADIFELGKYSGYRLQAGDILISHINSIAYLGRAVQYRGQLGEAPIIHGMNLLCARIKPSFCPTFIEYFFKTPSAKEYISTITKKAVNQASITTTDLKKMRIPAPPIAKQEQFEQFVSQVDKSKVVVQQALEKTQLLFDSLMQKYFG